MINPARFTANYNAADSTRRTEVRQGMVKHLTDEARKVVGKTPSLSSVGKPVV